MSYFYLDLSCRECNVISLYFLCFSVNVYVCLVCCVSDSVCKLFDDTIRIFLGVVVISVEVLCWIHHVWSSNECVLCL